MRKPDFMARLRDAVARYGPNARVVDLRGILNNKD